MWKEAKQWFEKSVDERWHQNDFSASHIGNMYRKGNGVEKSPTDARKWYKKSADIVQNHWRGTYYYGICLIQGYGGFKDSREGMKYVLEAANNDNSKAMIYLDSLNMHYNFQ